MAGTEEPGLAGVWRARETRLRYGAEARLPAGTLVQRFVGLGYAQLGPYRSAPVPRRNERRGFGTPPACGYRSRTKRRGPVRRGGAAPSRGSDALPAGTEAPGLVRPWRLRKARLRYGPEAPLPAGTEARPFVGLGYAQLGPYRSAPVPRRNERRGFGTDARRPSSACRSLHGASSSNLRIVHRGAKVKGYH